MYKDPYNTIFIHSKFLTIIVFIFPKNWLLNNICMESILLEVILIVVQSETEINSHR